MGVSGGTLDSIGEYGGNFVLRINGEWTRIDEMLSDAVSSDNRFTPLLLGQD